MVDRAVDEPARGLADQQTIDEAAVFLAQRRLYDIAGIFVRALCASTSMVVRPSLITIGAAADQSA